MKYELFKSISEDIILFTDILKLDPYITTSNMWGITVKFRDTRIGSVLISDGPRDSKYAYKFNVRTDIKESFQQEGRNYYTPTDIKLLIQDVNKRAKEIHTPVKYVNNTTNASNTGNRYHLHIKEVMEELTTSKSFK